MKFASIVVAALITLASFAYADGKDKGDKGGGSTAVSASATSSATGGSGVGSVSQDNKAYGVGGTGLTSTANCLGSQSVLFGLIAATYVEKGCITRLYAAQCKDDACRKKLACLDPDLMDEAKAALGCR